MTCLFETSRELSDVAEAEGLSEFTDHADSAVVSTPSVSRATDRDSYTIKVGGRISLVQIEIRLQMWIFGDTGTHFHIWSLISVLHICIIIYVLTIHLFTAVRLP